MKSSRGFVAQAQMRQHIMLAFVWILLALVVVFCYDERLGLNLSFWLVIGTSLLLLALFFRQMRLLLRNVSARDDLSRELELMREENRNLRQLIEAAQDSELAEESHDDHHKELGRLVEELPSQSDAKSLVSGYFEVLASSFGVVQGLLFLEREEGVFRLAAGYAHYTEAETSHSFTRGETLTGQVVRDDESLYLSDIPEDYMIIVSGLGRSAPKHLFIIPLSRREESQPQGAVELAFFRDLSNAERQLVEGFTQEFGARLLSVSTVELQ